jgi:hypothetical protein
MAVVVYVLCLLTSLACAVLLLRGYAQQGVRLLLWSGLCFAAFALNNAALIADRVIWPQYDLAMMRNVPVLAGLLVLIYGLVWDAR